MVVAVALMLAVSSYGRNDGWAENSMFLTLRRIAAAVTAAIVTSLDQWAGASP
jgi:hypothetical protein